DREVYFISKIKTYYFQSPNINMHVKVPTFPFFE
ncbi:MAG: hypothetical protein ACI85H_001076, partial [Paracoccaceae bacterium]